MQVVFHIDLNSFYASAEIAENPQFEGKPLVVSGQSRHGIITAANYEARKFGIHSAMPLYQAENLCPNLIVRPNNFTLYRKLSNDFFDIISNYSEIIEIASIDECYVDVTEVVEKYQRNPYLLAKVIQDDVYEKLSLPCSIGIAPNLFLAKMASDMKKPMGITMITMHNIKEVLWPLPIEEMYGIGPKTAEKLKKIDINTIGDLALTSRDNVKTILGKNSIKIINRARGIQNRKVNPKSNIVRSVGNSTTFDYDSNDYLFLKEKLLELSQSVSNRAIKNEVFGNVVSITLKDTDFKSISRAKTLDYYFNDAETIYNNALFLLDMAFDNSYFRLIGVSLNNTKQKKYIFQQLDLFTYKQVNKTIKDKI